MTNWNQASDVWGKLAAPFDGSDTHDVRQRLDSVVPGEWDLTLELLPTLPDGTITFKARIQILGVIREHIGSGTNYKLASSEAFMAAASRYGIVVGAESPANA